MKKTNYFIVRTDLAGVFFAKIKSRNGNEAVLTDCRKLFYWDGAAAIEQLANEGVKAPDNCKFTVAVKEMAVFGVIQIITCTKESITSIKAVKEWKI